MPIGVRAMPMPSAMNGMAADQPCPSCPRHPQTGDVNPDKMPGCQMILACAGLLSFGAARANGEVAPLPDLPALATVLTAARTNALTRYMTRGTLFGHVVLEEVKDH
jgi:hypothetical protein